MFLFANWPNWSAEHEIHYQLFNCSNCSVEFYQLFIHWPLQECVSLLLAPAVLTHFFIGKMLDFYNCSDFPCWELTKMTLHPPDLFAQQIGQRAAPTLLCRRRSSQWWQIKMTTVPELSHAKTPPPLLICFGVLSCGNTPKHIIRGTRANTRL